MSQSPDRRTSGRRRQLDAWCLIAILVLAGVMRLAWLGRAPDGVHVDEASNVFNATCVSAVFMDEHAQSWPVFYTRAFNDNRSALFLYVLAPFVGAGGMEPWVFRLPAALAGVLAVGLLYMIVREIGPPRLALLAALLLAIDPTHVQHTRWAHETSITTTLVLLSLWLWQRSGLIWSRRAPGPRWALVAGLVTGLACYAYAPVRIYLPLLWAASMLLAPVRTDRAARRSLVLMLLGFALLFAPLAYVHLTDDAINARAHATWTWSSQDTAQQAAGKVGMRYLEHFSPGFLFQTGTTEPTLAPPPGHGALGWVWAGLLPIGVGVCVWRLVRRARKLRSVTRLALVGLLLYPAGDILNAAGNASVLRSMAGWWVFALVGAVALDWLIGLAPAWRRWTCTALVAALLVDVGLYARAYLRHQQDPLLQSRRGVDFRQACKFVRPVMSRYDAVVFTTTDAVFGYAQVLVYLHMDPIRFLKSPIVRGIGFNADGPEPEILLRAGNLFFLPPGEAELQSIIDQTLDAGYARRSLWILRPAEARPGDRVLQEIKSNDGTTTLLIIERRTDPRPDPR